LDSSQAALGGLLAPFVTNRTLKHRIIMVPNLNACARTGALLHERERANRILQTFNARTGSQPNPTLS
jgi:hypothetical protein